MIRVSLCDVEKEAIPIPIDLNKRLKEALPLIHQLFFDPSKSPEEFALLYTADGETNGENGTHKSFKYQICKREGRV